MNLFLRLLWLLLSFRFREKLFPPLGVSKLALRVLPNDLDTNLHLNNGRYLTLMDLGRADLMLRSGMARVILQNGWVPMLSGVVIRYRRELRLFQAFELQSRLLYWSEKSFVMEQKFIGHAQDDETYTAAIALVRGGVYARKTRQFIDAAALFSAIGYAGPSPEASAEVAAFLNSEGSLKKG